MELTDRILSYDKYNVLSTQLHLQSVMKLDDRWRRNFNNRFTNDKEMWCSLRLHSAPRPYDFIAVIGGECHWLISENEHCNLRSFLDCVPFSRCRLSTVRMTRTRFPATASWSGVLGKLIVAQTATFLFLCGIRRPITVFKRGRRWCLSCALWFEFRHSLSIFKLCFNSVLPSTPRSFEWSLQVCLPKACMHFLISNACYVPRPLLHLIILMLFGDA
jgi:hypothetical protein